MGKLKADYEEFKVKFDAKRSREKTLETTVRDLKSHVSNLVAKAEKDSSLIQSLKKQVSLAMAESSKNSKSAGVRTVTAAQNANAVGGDSEGGEDKQRVIEELESQVARQ